MKRKKYVLFSLFLSFVLSFNIVTVQAVSTTGSIAIPLTTQQKTNWCWAACVSAITDYKGNYIYQGNIVNWAYGTTTYPNYAANFTTIQNALSHWSINSTYASGNIGFSSVRGNVNNGRPIIAGWIFRDGSNSVIFGHTVVIKGYDMLTSSSGYVQYMDPAQSDYQYLLYTDFVSKYYSSSGYTATWEESLYSIY